MNLFTALIILCSIELANSSICSNNIKTGPYTLTFDEQEINVPSKRTLTIERARITKNVEIAMMYRSYYSSYCYNGGSLDPNTGCDVGITQILPDYEESSQWIKQNMCSVGYDCTNCWGSDAQACLEAKTRPRYWTNGKEIIKHANNNHFPFHTCNLSYRCGIHTTQFPTLLTRSKTTWKAYTEFANGTELVLDARDYWVSGDMVMRKVSDHDMVIEEIRIPCFESTGKVLSCYDETFGNFIEFVKSWRCLGKFCYELADPKEHTMERMDEHSLYAKLQAASKEDLLKIVTNEHMLNEEMRYNFGLVLKELSSLKKNSKKFNCFKRQN